MSKNKEKFTEERENLSKDKKNGSSIYTGVSKCKQTGMWEVRINIKGKSYHLGRFRRELDAAAAYQNKLIEIL